MLFNSPVFLFIFLPVVLLFVFIKNLKLQNSLLVFFSLLFYAWGGVSYTLVLLISIIINYIAGLLIDTNVENNKKKFWLILAIILNLGLLGYFKYINFFVDNLNLLFSNNGWHHLKNSKISLPIGISFYTFHGISYVVDIYRQKAKAQKNILNLGLYFMFFPQLIAGPIVRYHNIEKQLFIRQINLLKIYSGVERFVYGLAKKTLIANTFALIADEVFKMSIDKIDFYFAWLGAISYTIQIYFDFSGYSDMAIGLALIFGFTFPENFNLPYISQSIKEFWQRWHISLSTWFKDYLYIPLGGNQKSTSRTYLNLLIVFLCTGFWHGASFNFIIWGIFHGLFIVLERIGIVERIFPFKILKHIYTMLIVIIAWVFFRTENLPQAFTFIISMFGNGKVTPNIFPIFQYLNLEVFLVGIMALILMFGLHISFSNFLEKKWGTNFLFKKSKFVVNSICLLGLFFLSLIYIGASTYNSFIYYRF